MEHSTELNELAAALAKAQADIQTAHKAADNPFFNSKYADMAACWDACREPLSKQGLSVVQMPSTGEGEVVVTTMLMHSSGQWIKETMACKPAKNDAQAMGSVTTYLRRYMLMGAAGIAPADDDGNAAVKGGEKTAEQMTPTEKKKAGLWQGPLAVTALKNKLRGLSAALKYPATQDAVEAIKQEYADVLEQAAVDLPDWYEGADKAIEQALKDALPEAPEPEVSDYTVPVGTNGNGADWGGWCKSMIKLIEGADSLVAVNEICDANLAAFENFRDFNAQDAGMLEQMVENRRGVLAQAPA